MYGALGVPELWHFDGERIEVLVLQQNGTYVVAEMTLAFPFLKPSELKQFLDLYQVTDQNSIMRRVRQWARQLPS